MFTLYKYAFQTRAERVIWTLNELGFEYQVKVVNPMEGETYTPEFLSLNPQPKVPVLIHDGKAYTESLAIMEYLNDLHPDKPLTPKSADATYLMRQALSFGVTELESYTWIRSQATILKQLYAWPEGTADEALDRMNKAAPIIWEWLS